MTTSKSPTLQRSDWSKSRPVSSHHQQAFNEKNQINTRSSKVFSIDDNQDSSKDQSKIISNKYGKLLLKWWSSIPLFIRGLLFGILAGCLILTILLSVWLTKGSTAQTNTTITTTTTSTSTTSTTTTTTITTTTITTTTPPPAIISALWTFDQTTTDSYGVYNGIMINGANYSLASTTQPYIGNGRALSLLAASNQEFIVSAPFFDLSYTSFTVEAWIYLTNAVGDHGIFSQCTCSTCSNQCFYFIVRSGHLYADFTFNGLSGSTIIATSTWYHVAFVYNYTTNQQILYLKGVQDAIASNAQPYQGTNAPIQIGAAQESPTTCYFNGYIDNVKLTTRAKSSTELLFDASVTAYYPFDLPSVNNDNGPNGLNGLSNSTVVVTGRVNQAMHFGGSFSFFQAYGFYQIVYSISNQPFSVSLWINPSWLSSATIVQITQQQWSGSCFNFIGITSTNGVTGQLIVQGYSFPVIYGPFLTINTWMHVSVTYSSADGMTLYVNGVLFGSTGSYTFSSTASISWLQIGYNFASTAGGIISNGGYQGSIDEVYIHSRELTQADITGLANP